MSNLLKSNLTVAAGTALSRITGLLRASVLLYVLGRSALTDAYLIANETPNIVYELLLGGVLSATLVPLFSAFAEDDDDESTNVVMTVTAILMAALTTLAILAAPLIVRLYSLNIPDGTDPELFRSVATTLARIFLIQILFYGLVSLATSYLNSRRRFFAAAWSPILPNLIIVATLLTIPDAGQIAPTLADVLSDTRLRLTLGLGATLGIGSMLFVLIPAMRGAGFRASPNANFRHPAVKRLMTMSFWTIGFVVANQLAILVVRNLALDREGDVTAYFNAYTFFVLPHGLLAVSIATTFQPELARAVARHDRTAFVAQASLGVRMTALLTIPAGIGIFVLRRPLVGALLQHGSVTADDALVISRALAGFALGLGAFSIYLFVLRGFYAHKDTKTAFTVNVIENAINIGLAFLLYERYGVLGLGLAFAIAYAVSAVFALQVLSIKVPGFSVRELIISIWPMLVAGALMGETVWLVTRSIGGNVGAEAIMRLAVGSVVGIVVYGALLVALGAPELDALRSRLPARFARAGGPRND